MLKEIKDKLEGDNQTDDVLYIESPYGTFSMNELHPVKNEHKEKQPLVYLKMQHDIIKNFLEVEELEEWSGSRNIGAKTSLS